MGSAKSLSFQKIIVLACCVFSTHAAAEQQYASKERATVARAHMSRARALMVEALAEFEEAKKYARPDMLIDSEDWRLRVISLTEQLNRVVDPKPRVTREGAVFRTPPRFVKRQKDQLPEVSDGAFTRSDAGEKNRMKQKQQERARLFTDKKTTAKDQAKLPEELALPEEPILEGIPQGKENAAGKAATAQEPKNLFSNDLMPQLPEKELPTKKMEDSGLKKSEDLNTSKMKESFPEDKISESLKEDVRVLNTERNAPPTIIEPKEDAKKAIIVEEEQEADLSDNQLLPPQERTKSVAMPKNDSIITSESVPTISDDEVGVPEEQAAKQISEDDELAKKLEDSISKKLSQRESERN